MKAVEELDVRAIFFKILVVIFKCSLCICKYLKEKRSGLETAQTSFCTNCGEPRVCCQPCVPQVPGSHDTLSLAFPPRTLTGDTRARRRQGGEPCPAQARTLPASTRCLDPAAIPCPRLCAHEARGRRRTLPSSGLALHPNGQSR